MRTLRRVQCLAGMLVLAGCDTTVAAPSPTHDDVHFRTDTTAAAYFGELRSWRDSVWLPSFATALHELDEPPLRGAKLVRSGRVLRFFWQRSFNPAVAVRITESAAGCSVVTTVRTPKLLPIVQLDSISDAAASESALAWTLRRDSTALASAICADLFGQLEAIGVATDRPHSPGGGVDGTHWLFERVDARGHACLEAWSPDSTSERAVWKAGMAFLSAGGALPVDAREMY